MNDDPDSMSTIRPGEGEEEILEGPTTEIHLGGPVDDSTGCSPSGARTGPDMEDLGQLASSSASPTAHAEAPETNPRVPIHNWRQLSQNGDVSALLAALDAHSGARHDMEVRAHLHTLRDPRVLAWLCRDAEGEEFRTLVRRLRAYPTVLREVLLDDSLPDKAALKASDLVPLLKSEFKEVRLAALSAVRHLRPEQRGDLPIPLPAEPSELLGYLRPRRRLT